MNELGANLANIMDDTQMAYMNLEQYADLTRIERKQKPPNRYTFDTSKNSVRDVVLDKAFKDEWDAGVRMKWLLTSSEGQKPSTNWRQDINKPDHTMKKLASYQFSPANANAQTGASPVNDACPISPGEVQVIMKEHYNSIHSSNSDVVSEWAKVAENEIGPQANAALEAVRMCNQQGWANDLIRLAKQESVDPLFMFSLFAAESGCEAGKAGGGILQLEVVRRQQEAASKANKKYNVTYATEIEGAIKAWKAIYNKVNAEGNPMLAATAFCAHGKIGGNIKMKATKDQRFNNEWIDDAKIDYKSDDMATILYYWPRIVYFYEAFLNMDQKKSVMSTGSTDFDFDFPFADIDLDKVYFTSDYHSSNKSNINIDNLKGNEDSDNSGQQSAGVVALQQFISFKVEGVLDVFAAKRGTIKEIDDSATNKTITIDYGNNQVLKYCGFTKFSDNSLKAKSNPGSDASSVKVKDVLGQIKGTMTVMYYKNGTLEDPKLVWNKLNGKVSEKQSLGKQLAEGERLGGMPAGANKDGVTVALDNSVIGGDTVGVYDMDDPNNYFWNLDDSKSLKKGEGGASDSDPTNNSGENDNRSENKITNGPSITDYTLKGDNSSLTPSNDKYSGIVLNDFKIPADSYVDNSVEDIEDHQMTNNNQACLQHHYVLREDAISSGLPLSKYSSLSSGDVMIISSGNMAYGDLSSSMIAKTAQLVAALGFKYGFEPSKNTVKMDQSAGNGLNSHYDEIISRSLELYNGMKSDSAGSSTENPPQDTGDSGSGSAQSGKRHWRILRVSVDKVIASHIDESVFGESVSCESSLKGKDALEVTIYGTTSKKSYFKDTITYSAGGTTESEKPAVTNIGSTLSKYVTAEDFSNAFEFS